MKAPGREGPRLASFLLVVATALSTSCEHLRRLPPDDHVVAAPISSRANIVLRNLVEEFGSRDGRWLRCMSPGCTQIWATQFGYRAGVRRDREDILAIGQRTAEREAADLRSLFWDSLFGEFRDDDPALFGFPALFVSATLGGRGFDRWVLLEGVERLDEILEGGLPDPDSDRENAGIAALLAAVAQVRPDRRDEHLDRAGAFAEQVTDGGGGTLAALAWAAIARVSEAPEDVTRARQAADATHYEFDPQSGALVSVDPDDEILSSHLTLIHALADLAQASRDPIPRARALSLLDYLFSDAYFDGRFLSHDRGGGVRSEEVCSGCNFMALYLVDRLYGDAFVIDHVPPLPAREIDPIVGPPGEWDFTLFVEEGTEESSENVTLTLEPLPSEGSLAFVHRNQGAWVTVRYRAEVDRIIAYVKVHAGWDIETIPEARFDSDGVARFPTLGMAPVLVGMTFRRTDDGALRGDFRSWEIWTPQKTDSP